MPRVLHSNIRVTLAPVDYVILALYFAFVLGIGWRLRKRVSTSGDFLLSGRSVPVWITSLAFLAANLGAQELIGMSASGAKYGIMTSHFYWIGAVPAMLFVGVFMMPFYYGSRARSVPEYLKLRFDEKTRAFNAFTFAVMTIFSSGISMYALGLLLQLVLGWSFTTSVLCSAAIVLAYTFLGGLTSAIYNEVLQFLLIVIGFAPLAILAVMKAGGWARHGGAPRPCLGVMTHSWEYMGSASQNPMGVEVFGHGGRAWFRALVRILVHGFSGGAARHGRRIHVRRAAHAADRRFPEDVHSVHRDRAGHRGGRARQHGHRLRPAHEDAAGAGAGLRPGAHHADGEVLSSRHAGCGAHRADGFLHVRHGGQRDRVQHRLDLRHLPELYPHGRTR